ncbi:DUF4332 domain-containing protein [Legionella londiniensis]|uniref:DUF4332 domain-containing protein n=1 Tax=Legionella londiniensis TaxID=45068 RepID=A0A0W0VTY4_9GAMM|nr:DUF4332 domain-containing protein [Legionella londiniensis]KTD23321.1 hypothetical protein Llon_0206 [Legionella londiniensis]STX94124.1 TfoX C-terminal domain [Legionella londiniensis]
MYKLSKLENIGVKFAALLLEAGIEDQEQLLDFCRLRNKRLELAQKTGINPKLIYKWTIEADLARITGIGGEYAELLQYCDIDSVQTLAVMDAEKLQQILEDENKKTKLVRHLPSLNQIETWIAQAKKLPPVVEK